MDRMRSLYLFLALALVSPSSGAAQEGVEISLIPRLGLLSPGNSLYEEFKNFSGDGYVEWTNGSLGRAALAGVALEMGYGDPGVRIRGEVARSFEGWLTATHGVLIPRVYFDPPRVVNTWFDLPAAVTWASLQAILPTRLSFRGIAPYVLLGFSGKWYSFGPPNPENTVGAILPSDGFEPSADLGGGVTVGLFGLTLEAQVRDNINKYWERTQHDLSFSAGLVWRVR